MPGNPGTRDGWHIAFSQEIAHMRAASYAAGVLITVSLYLIIAASMALAPALIAAGSVGIAFVAAIVFVARNESQSAA